ncbi:MAG: histidine kinase [Geobacteraceae bacterium GWC2_58_44]|nr:MAG: histidine kinase [Geobacteraceae bacterium GWC2_58_44]HBG07927.1 response regulator [Geobacter sp.]
MTTRILLAEDNERLAAMLRSFLESLGHEVLSATDGVAALAALQGGGIDLLILDLKLPGMSGVELLQRIRRSPPPLKTLPVIISTGVYRGEQYARGAEKLGVKAYLEKPFTKEAFLQAVRSSIEQAPPRRQFADLLTELYRSRKSGTLELSGGTLVTLLTGEPVCFSSPEFIPYLLSSGHLSGADLERYPMEGSRRLQLTESGLLSYDELIEQSRLFLSKRLLEAIEHDQAASFTPESPAIQPPLTPVPLPRLMLQGARGGAARFETSALLQRGGALYPARTGEYYRLANLFTMAREEIELLELLDRGLTLEALVAAGSDRQRAASFVGFLIRMGMVWLGNAPAPDRGADFPQKRLFNRPIEEVAEADPETMSFEDLVDEVSESVELVVGEEGMAAPLSASEIGFEQEVQRDYAAIQDKNYYEIFSLTPGNFNFASLKEAYFSRTRHYSPEKFMQLSGATLSRAQDVLSHYANAYNTLSNVVAKERYDEMMNASSIGLGGRQDDGLQARIQFQSGKVFIEMEDFVSAERALQDAYTLTPQDPLTAAYLAWSIYRNPSNSGSRAAQEKCRMLLSKSLQMGRCAEAFAFRGWMLLDEGRDGLAEGEFLKALKLNPREQSAQAGTRLIAERRETEKKGLFKRIFG